MYSEKHKRRRKKEREEERVCVTVSVLESEKKRLRDEAGRPPTQMTSEFHPLSQIQRSAVTTKTGCQGDPLYLSIKGTPCEDCSDLETKQCIRSGECWHLSGHNMTKTRVTQ